MLYYKGLIAHFLKIQVGRENLLKKRIFLILALIILFVTICGSSLSYASSAIDDPVQTISNLEAQPEEAIGRITGIEVRGNLRIDRNTIVAATGLRIGDTLYESNLAKAIDGIYALGYFSYVYPDGESYLGGLRIIFVVQETPVIQSINFIGNTLVKSEDLLKVMSIQVGRMLNMNFFQRDLDKISEIYQNSGYIVMPYMSDLEDGDLIITIVELKVSEVNISGNQKTKSDIILTGISLKPEDYVSITKIQEDLRMIYNTGAFEEPTPNIELDPNRDGYVIVTYELVEAKTGVANIGLTYSGQDKLMGYAELGSTNLFGRLEKLSVTGSFGKNQISYEISLGLPWLFSNKNSLELSVFNKDDQKFSYELPLPLGENGAIKQTMVSVIENTKGISIQYGRRLTPNVQVFVGYEFSYQKSKIKDDDDGSIADAIEKSEAYELDGFLYNKRSGILTIGAMLDFTDNQIATTRGVIFSVYLNINNKLLGATNNSVKLSFTTQAYLPLFKKDVLAIRAAYRTALGSKSSDISDKFALGGTASLRGYSDSQFRGDSVVFVNFENRYNITDSFQVVLFCDIGYAWDKYGAESNAYLPNNVLIGYGVGLRVNVPFLGTLRLDYGINRDGKGQVHFGFQQMF